MTSNTINRQRVVFNRVPRVTVAFWIIKLLAVTMGETAADYLAVNLGLGLSTTSWIMVGVLVIALILQFAQKKYVPWAYWLAVVLISVVGTLVTDNLVDNFGVKLLTTVIAFSVLLAGTFAVWYAIEETLSIHTIFTTRRETFYWFAILFTFALGTAVGDWVSEEMGLGYVEAGFIFAAIIAVITLLYYRRVIGSVLAFWLAYILTRPVGASLGDLLSQPTEYGGLGFGTIVTSAMFLACIALIVIYMSFFHELEVAPAPARTNAN